MSKFVVLQISPSACTCSPTMSYATALKLSGFTCGYVDGAGKRPVEGKLMSKFRIARIGLPVA